MYTITQIVVLCALAMCAFMACGIMLLVYGRKSPFSIFTMITSIIAICGLCCGVRWYNTNTAAGIRYMKDYKSEISNGLDREITITAEDGREIFHYEGKVDVESNHTDNYIKFESEEGKRYLIYYGVQDTIKIIEK